MGVFVGGDLCFVFQRQADVVQSVQQAVAAKGFDFDQLADWAIAQGGHVQMDEVNPPRLPGKMVDRPGQEYRCLYVPESAFQDES